MGEQEKSISWIVAVSMVVVAIVGWGVLASSHVGAHAPLLSDGTFETSGEIVVPRRPGLALAIAGLIAFLWTALVQLPNFVSVISYHLTNRVWLPIAIIAVEVLVFCSGFGLKLLEKQLEQPYRTRR